MYTNTTAEFRPELQVKVEEGMAADKQFIADKIFPVYPVETRKGYYKKIKRGRGQTMTNFGRSTPDDPLKRAPGTAYREVTRSFDQGGWICTDRGLEEAMDDVNKQEESRFFDLEAATARLLKRNIRIAREKRVADFCFDPDNWGSIEATTAFDLANINTFDFASVMKAGIALIDKRGEEGNTAVMSRNIYDLVTSSILLRTYFFGTSNGSASIDANMIAEKFGLEQILIGRSSFDTTKLGQDSTDNNLVWTWSDEYIWIGNVKGGAPENGGAGRTFVLEQLTGGQLYVTETYREEKIRSDRLRVREDDDTNIINENAGVLIKVNDL